MSTSAPTVPPELAALLEGGCALPHLGVIQAQGEEAAQFLHNQLTQDVLLLPVGQARLAAFCNAKGRVQASFVLLKTAPDTVLLVLQADLLAQTLKRLSMFVLRAKVRLSDATAQWQLQGLAGAAARAAMGDAAPWQAQAQAQAQAQTQAGAWTVALPPAGVGEARVPRALQLTPAGQTPPVVQPLEAALWAWGEVLSAVPLITAELFEAFVPQMLNYESVGGVNFKKGCYPGQEVVARSQFRGTLKRRAYLVHADAPLAVGDSVFHEGDAEQPTGTVAAAAAHPVSGCDAIVSMQTSSAEGGALTVGSATGPALQLLPLPYPLRDDI